ncbi:MAG TPA: hypothetical protein VF944_04415 [Candidatus Bathyarchaeia archaeon]
MAKKMGNKRGKNGRKRQKIRGIFQKKREKRPGKLRIVRDYWLEDLGPGTSLQMAGLQAASRSILGPAF